MYKNLNLFLISIVSFLKMLFFSEKNKNTSSLYFIVSYSFVKMLDVTSYFYNMIISLISMNISLFVHLFFIKNIQIKRG